MTQNTYRMSSAGKCARALSAQKLGIKAAEAPAWLSRAGDEGKWHEWRLVHQLRDEGYDIYDQQKELVIEKNGYRLVGHIDGVAKKGGQVYLLEIKSMSQYEFDRWMKGRFLEFLSYADQITCYMTAGPFTQTLYLVKNRSSGYIDRDILTGPPSDPDLIFNKLDQVEEWVAKQKLYPAEFSLSELECRRCFFRTQVCVQEKENLPEATKAELSKAAEMVKEGLTQKKAGEDLYREGKGILTGYMSIVSPEKKHSFRVDDVLVSRFRVPAYGDFSFSYPRKELEETVPEEFLMQVRKSKPFEWRTNVYDQSTEDEGESSDKQSNTFG